jgi:Dolichyl-phosphate-mannose-protein mannosyltransferase
MRNDSDRYNLYFTAFIICHILIWTILPFLTRSNMHLDALEAIIWGQEWQFGYQKHPPLSAWFAQSIMIIFHKKVWAGYLMSQICIAASLTAMWRLAKIFLPLSSALMAVLILEGVYYYNFTSTEFNTNILMMALWSWSIFYAWKSFSENKPYQWLMLGALIGLTMITKYFALMLGVSIFLMLTYEPKFRAHFKTYKPYLALAAFVAVTLPHLIWLIKNNFPTIEYLDSRASTEYHFYNHLLIPISFTAAQLLSMLFALIIFLITFPEIFKVKLTIKNISDKILYYIYTFLEPKKPYFWGKNSSQDTKKIFLIFMFFGPFILSIAPSLLTASKMKDMWGTPLWGLCGIMLFYFFNPKLSTQKFKRFFIAWSIVMFISVAAYVISNLIAMVKLEKRNSFNGEMAAKEVTEKWHEYNSSKLPIVVGDIWLGSNVSFFSPESPRVFIDMNSRTAPWLSFQDLENQGGVIVWDIKDEGEELPERYRNKINSKIIIEKPILISSPAKKYHNQQPFKLGLAVILPRK